MKLWAIHVLFLASGATALAYQIAWQRRLSLIFGASFEAVSIVLAAFMVGLAAGGFYFGRRIHRHRRPLALYGALEIGVAVFAALLPLLLGLVQTFYLDLALQTDGVDWRLNTARVVMAILVLLPATFFMGGTLPVLIQFLVRERHALGDRLSRLYAINTLGAVVGTLTAGFLLLPRLGVMRSEWVTIAANLTIGVAALWLDRSRAAVDTPAPPQLDEGRAAQPTRSLWPYRLAFWGTFAAGTASLALEVAWSRAITIASGANTYSFSVMLATFLIGIALGSHLQSAYRPKGVPVSLRFAAVMLLAGASSLLVSLLIPRLPEIAMILETTLLGGGAGVRAGTTFALSFLVMLLPCVFMGAAFPLAGEARARLDLRFGASVGDLVGLNTAGAILGSLLAGFVLIPYLGLQRTMLLAASVYVGYGLLVACAVWGDARDGRRALATAGGAIALPAAVALAFAFPGWDVRSLAAVTNNDRGVFVNADGELDFEAGLGRTELLYAREGRGSLVSVIRTGGVRSLLINGKVVASDEVGDMQHEYLLGHLPTLLHPAPKSAVVIGLGAGLTLGGVAAHESLERIVVVEIEPAVEGAAQLFADLHDDALSDPRVELVWQDGRNYLATTSQRFDVITADPIHPWAQGAAYLYTTEYYAIVASRLAPGGVACQWLPLYELSEDDLKSVIAAFVANFEHATLWQATGDLLLIGSDTPIRVDLDQLAARIARPRAARQLARAGLDDPLSLLAEFNMDRDAMQRFSRGGVVNTDDNLYLEYSSPLSIGIHPGRHLPRFDRTRASAIAVVRDRGTRFTSDEELALALDDLRAAKSRTLQAAPQWHQVHAAPTAEGLAALAAEYREALALGPYRHAALLLAHSEAWSGELALERGDSEGAMELFRSAFAADPGSVTANLRLGLEASSRGQPQRALSHFERAAARDPQSVAAQTAAAQTLMQLGRFADARQRLRLAIALRPEVAALHRLECRCLRRLGQLTAAVETCRTARRLTLEAGEGRP